MIPQSNVPWRVGRPRRTGCHECGGGDLHIQLRQHGVQQQRYTRANSAVQSYMTGVLAGTTVTGAGELSNNQYTGDGHVVGPVSGTTVTPLTLGSTNGGVQHSLSTTSPDNYIVNNPSTNTTIEIIFPKAMYTVSFDYEIFPDGTCPNPTSGVSHIWAVPALRVPTGRTSSSMLTAASYPTYSDYKPWKGTLGPWCQR